MSWILHQGALVKYAEVHSFYSSLMFFIVLYSLMTCPEMCEAAAFRLVFWVVFCGSLRHRTVLWHSTHWIPLYSTRVREQNISELICHAPRLWPRE